MNESIERRRPWWQVTPHELAWRHGCDAENLRASIHDPDQLEDWQSELLFDAIAYAELTLPRITVPPREDET